MARSRDIAARRTRHPANPLNPELVVHALSAQLPADARVAVDVGSITYWYARHLMLRPDVPAHLSSYLASMGCALPYGLAAKFDAPDRPVVALAGDRAMQMNGLLELITVADRWRSWADPRFIVLVLRNGDLNEVTWEQRGMEGDPRYPQSQRVPPFPHAAYADSACSQSAWTHRKRPDPPGSVRSLRTGPATSPPHAAAGIRGQRG